MTPAELAAELEQVRSHLVTAADKLHALVVSIPASLADQIERLRLASAEHYAQWGKWQRRADELAAKLRADQARIDELKAKKDAGPKTIPDPAVS